MWYSVEDFYWHGKNSHKQNVLFYGRSSICIYDLIHIIIKKIGVHTEYCSDMNGSQKFKCQCNDGFDGERCKESVCPSNFCKNNGTCTSEISVDGTLIWECDCPIPFEGKKI